jgi:hypothetical protein
MIVGRSPSQTLLYVGSANLSESAWGTASGGAPSNIELGVVLRATDPAAVEEIVGRLPCELPGEDELGRTAAERGYTCPASGGTRVRNLAIALRQEWEEAGGRGDAAEHFRPFYEGLREKLKRDAGVRASGAAACTFRVAHRLGADAFGKALMGALPAGASLRRGEGGAVQVLVDRRVIGDVPDSVVRGSRWKVLVGEDVGAAAVEVRRGYEVSEDGKKGGGGDLLEFECEVEMGLPIVN